MKLKQRKVNFSNVSKHHITRSITQNLLDFCSETSLHGCKRIAILTNQQVKKRLYLVFSYEILFCKLINLYKFDLLRKCHQIANLILWITAVSLGVIFAMYLMYKAWNSYRTKPTIVTIETNNYPIWNVAFPGVTICNVNTVYKPKMNHFMKLFEKNGIPSNISLKFFQSLPALVTFHEVLNDEFLKIFDILKANRYTPEFLMFELTQPCENMLRNCSWLGRRISCENLFRISKSGFGFCCSFNYKALRNSFEIETTADDYYQINTPVIRISGAGEDVGLVVLLDVEPNEYVAPKRFLYGAEIIIHDAEDFPEKSLLTAFGQPGLEVSIAVIPSVVITEPSAEALPVNLRFCRFSYEKKLKITKKYSFQSCITECRAYTILQKCDCLPFFYPPLYYKNSSEQSQCTLRDIKCLSDNKHVFASIEPPVSIKETMYNILNITHIGMDCDCLPSCSEQIYNVQTFISKRFNQFKNNPIKYDNSTDNINQLTLIKVYFKDLSCIKYRRELFMTWDNLLASFGGIFGLCLGGSVLSLVEIVYFATFKFYAKYLHNKAEYKKHKKELEKLRSNPHYFNFNRRLFVPARQNQYKDLLW